MFNYTITNEYIIISYNYIEIAKLYASIFINSYIIETYVYAIQICRDKQKLTSPMILQ